MESPVAGVQLEACGFANIFIEIIASLSQKRRRIRCYHAPYIKANYIIVGLEMEISG